MDDERVPLEVDPGGLVELLRGVERRRRADGTAADDAEGPLERGLELLFEPSRRLAVYGSLRPGRENHAVVEGLGGTWREGWVRGHLDETGWGSGMGYPALRWDPEGEAVRVALLESAALPAHWARIDAFEGADYVRILVPVWADGRILAVANLYAAASERAR